MHVKLGKRLFEKKMDFKKITAKFSKICRIWEKGHGIICFYKKLHGFQLYLVF